MEEWNKRIALLKTFLSNRSIDRSEHACLRRLYNYLMDKEMLIHILKEYSCILPAKNYLREQVLVLCPVTQSDILRIFVSQHTILQGLFTLNTTNAKNTFENLFLVFFFIEPVWEQLVKYAHQDRNYFEEQVVTAFREFGVSDEQIKVVKDTVYFIKKETAQQGLTFPEIPALRKMYKTIQWMC
mgnify:CR=1 FL=1